ncbi:hypothetical protein D3C73_901790 [compost metagenome]
MRLLSRLHRALRSRLNQPPKRRGEGEYDYGVLEPSALDRRDAGPACRARTEEDPQLAAPDGDGRRSHRRHRHPDLDRGRGGSGGAGGADQLRPGGIGVRLRRPGLRRVGDHHARLGQRLYLFLCGAGRDLRLGRGVEPDPGILAGRLGRGGGLVGVCRAFPGGPGNRPAVRPDGRPARRGRADQPARRLHHRHRDRPTAAGHARKRDAERRAGGHQDRRPGGLRRHRPAAL